MASYRRIAVLLMIVLGSYAMYVWSWLPPASTEARAVVLLGGCESTNSVSRSTWPASHRLVPPTVRCLLREVLADSILNTQFLWRQRVGITPVQFYVGMGGLDANAAAARSEFRMEGRGIVIRSLDWLFEKGADPNQCDPEGLTALHLAAYFGEFEMYEKWVSLGANPDIVCEPRDEYVIGGRVPDRTEGTPREWLEAVKGAF